MAVTLSCLAMILSNIQIALAGHALQSGPDVGPSYAGGMVYDPQKHALYLTGATYGNIFDPGHTEEDDNPMPSSACFLGIARLPDTNKNVNVEWEERETYGTTTIPESCVSLALAKETTEDHHTHLYMIGSTEESGLLTDIRFPGSHKAKEYGIVLDVAVGGGGIRTTSRVSTLLGGALIQDEMIQYPRAIVADPTHSYVYVASMHTEETGTSPQWNKYADSKKYPNLTKGGLKKYGTDYGMLVERLRIGEVTDAMLAEGGLKETLTPTWRKPFGLSIPPSSTISVGEVGAGAGGDVIAPHETNLPNSVMVNHMVEVASKNTLVIVGATPGTGPAFGEDVSGLGDMDGFVLKLDTETGDMIAVKRTESLNFKDDWITHSCTGKTNDDFLFIVGITAGQLDQRAAVPSDSSVDAFISKLSLNTLEPVWTRQFNVTGGSSELSDGSKTGNAAYGIACSVTSDDSSVYFAGVVDQGAALRGQTSQGGDDIFVMKLDASNGQEQWKKQVGSAGNERLAHGGGLIVDKHDNAVVYGDTSGVMFRDGGGGNLDEMRDVFVMSFSKEKGEHIFQGSGHNNNGGTADGGRNDDTAPADVGENDTPDNGPDDEPTGDGTPDDTSPDDTGSADLATPAPTASPPKVTIPDIKIDEEKPTTSKSKFILVTLFLIVVTVASLYFVARMKHEKEVATERSHVFSYLNGFDVEDVDLRHSATGGWHGTYVNKLAHGVNKASPSDTSSPSGSSHNSKTRGSFAFENAPLAHSSVVKDSLFMDVDSKPALGGSSHDGSSDGDSMLNDDTMDAQSRGSASYDGLVGAYDDLKPRTFNERKSSLQSDDEDKPWGRDIV